MDIFPASGAGGARHCPISSRSTGQKPLARLIVIGLIFRFLAHSRTLRGPEKVLLSTVCHFMDGIFQTR